MNKYSLKRGGQRPQAWFGTVLALASTAANLYNNYKNKEAEVAINNANIAREDAEIERQNAFNRGIARAKAMKDYYDYEQQRRTNLAQDLIYACGGRKSLRAATGAKVKITDGLTGVVPLGNNTFLLQGSSHNQINESGHTGIGMKVGKRTIEAEGGEAVQFKPNSLRIFSNRIRPELLSGFTPSKAIQLGYNPDVIFPIQQEANGNHSTPVKGNRKKAAVGDWINFGSDIATALGTSLINRNAYNKLRVDLKRPEYYEETPVVLDTTYHNAAQLANLERMRLAGNRSIGQNSASSQVAQARMRLNNLDYGLKQNELMDYKENQEAALRNTQAQIDQAVIQRNIANKLQHSREVADISNRERELENNRTLMRTQNWTNMLAGFNRAGTNLYTAIQQRKADNNDLTALIASSNPGSYKTAIMNGFNPGVDALINEYNREIGEDNFDDKYLYKIRGMIPKMYWRRLSSPNG